MVWELYKCNLKRLVRSPIPLATILALFLFVNALGFSSLHQYGEPLAMLQNDIPSNLILFLGFLFLSFFCVQTAGRQVGESLGQGNGVRARQECCQLAVMVSVCLLVSCNYFLYPLIAYAKMGVSSSLLLLHLLKVTVLDFFLVGLLGISAGSAIGIWLSPTTGTVALLGTAILFSPAPQMVLSSFSSPDTNFSPLLDLFHIQLRNPIIQFDLPSYGIPNEAIRWDRIGFSIALFLFFWALRALPASRWQGKTAAALLAVLTGVSLWQYSRGGSYLYYGYNSENTLSKIGNLASEEREEVPAKFSVEGYQMELKIDRELHADVTVTLSDAQEQEEYVFTLYRGYHLQTLTDHLGNQLSWEQEGDWIRFSPVVSGTTAFRFSYSGSGDMFYSNRQGIFLPGYFPFYPMPGEKVVNDGLGFMTPIDRSQKQFEVIVHTDAPNLNCSLLPTGGDSCFAGESESVSLFAGLIEERQEDGIAVVTPIVPVLGEDPSFGVKAFDAANQRRTAGDVYEDYARLCDWCGAANDLKRPRKVFQVGETVPAGDPAYPFSDHWFLLDPRYSPYAATALFETRAELRPIFEYLGKDITAEMMLEGYDPESLRQKHLLWQALRAQFEDPDVFRATALRDPSDGNPNYRLLQATGRWGEPAVYRQVYRYLTDEEDKRTSAQFFAELESRFLSSVSIEGGGGHFED